MKINFKETHKEDFNKCCDRIYLKCKCIKKIKNKIKGEIKQ